jgi:hypothetical protein
MENINFIQAGVIIAQFTLLIIILIKVENLRDILSDLVEALIRSYKKTTKEKAVKKPAKKTVKKAK